MTTAASTRGLHAHVAAVVVVNDLPDALAAMSRANADALVVMENPSFAAHAKRIADLVLHHRLPAMLGNRLFVHAGGLMAYGLVYEDLWRRAATYFGFSRGRARLTCRSSFINPKTARALGLTIPPSVLARADQVIE